MWGKCIPATLLQNKPLRMVWSIDSIYFVIMASWLYIIPYISFWYYTGSSDQSFAQMLFKELENQRFLEFKKVLCFVLIEPFVFKSVGTCFISPHSNSSNCLRNWCQISSSSSSPSCRLSGRRLIEHKCVGGSPGLSYSHDVVRHLCIPTITLIPPHHVLLSGSATPHTSPRPSLKPGSK